MVQMLIAGKGVYFESQWIGVMLGLLIGTATAMASLVAGQHLAIALSPLSSSTRKSEGGDRGRRLLTVTVTGLCLGFATAALTLVIRHSGTAFWRKFYAAVLLAPLGAVVRWQLAALNGRSWFPIGTFAANMFACIISFAAQGVESRWTIAADYRIILFAVRTGFAGSLSTVSTWVVEVGILTVKSYLRVPDSESDGRATGKRVSVFIRDATVCRGVGLDRVWLFSLDLIKALIIMAHKRVKLVSSDGFEFVVDYEAACVSKTLNHMLSAEGYFTESALGEIKLQGITGRVLEPICCYFYFYLQYPGGKHPKAFQVDPTIALDVLMAANFLDT